MQNYAALLRGIAPMNPNMKNDKLRWLFEELGFKNVKTVISSGNVLFESRSRNIQVLEEKIENALPNKLDFHSTTIIRSKKQLENMIKRAPFKGMVHSKKTSLNVTFLKNTPNVNFKFPFHVENKGYKLIGMYDNAIFSVVDLAGSKTPDLMVWLEKQFGKEITTRTWKTVERIVKAFEK